MLTPEEFVECGDQLVHSCPTWAWAAGDNTRAKTYLPADKQFLITRNVPCHRRCKQVGTVHGGPGADLVTRAVADRRRGAYCTACNCKLR